MQECTTFAGMEYNTSRNQLVMPEYGRNIQCMVDYLRTIEDPEKRQKNAQAIIELMGVLNPHLKNVEDFRHKLWDHLYLIADFDLDVRSPYPTPTREKLSRKPTPINYPQKGSHHMHLGKNLMTLMQKAIAEPDAEKKAGLTQVIVYYMKLAYTNWHKELAHDDVIKDELHILSDGQLDFTTSNFKVHFNPNPIHSNKKRNGKNNNNNRNPHFNKNRKNKRK